MKTDLIEQSVKDWSNQEVTIKEVIRHINTWQDLVYALERVRLIDYVLVDNFVAELIEATF